MSTPNAENRLLQMADLQKAFYRRTVREMENLLARHAGFYLHPSKRWEYPWALERAGLSKCRHVLDVGCGASIFPLFLVRRGVAVTAMDPFLPESLRMPADPCPAYVRGRMQQLPFRSRAFDAVFCISVIEHLPVSDMHAALEEMARVLKPGGRLLLTTDYTRDAHETIWYEGPGDRFAVDWNIFDRAGLDRLLDAANGLEVDGELDLTADWPRIRREMRGFHGYPYTSVGIAFRKQDPGSQSDRSSR